jgi:PAS domain S-box-containing protein
LRIELSTFAPVEVFRTLPSGGISMSEADGEFQGQDRSTPGGRAALQARLAAIIDSSDDGIVSKDLNGVVQSWNDAAEQIFGYTADEIVGRSIRTIIPADRQHEEDEILARIRRGERIEHFRTVRQRKDGRLIPVSVTISPVHDADGRVVAASKIVRDLSAVSELEGYFQAIIESSDDGIVSKDLNGIVRSWNPAAERIFGYTAAEMVGRPIEVIFPADRKDEEPKILERLRRGERVDHFETVRLRKDGTPIDVSVTISPVRSPTGEIIGASKVARDITAYKRLLRQLEELLESERHARQEAERASRVKDEFLATLSHELRTPLNAILGWALLLRERAEAAAGGVVADGVFDEFVEGLEVIQRNTRVQTQLIEDLLDMSRITAGKLRLDVQQVDVADVVKAAVASVRHAAEAKGIRLQVVLDPLAGPVRGDPARLQQCVWNLLTNSVKFTPKGGKVQVALERVNSHLEVCVTDSGEGITPQLLPHLFERFRQGDASTTRQHGGLGLGLSIVKHLIELHGGSVRAKSPGPGQGSTFCIELPLMVVHAPADEGHRTHPRAQVATSWSDLPSLDGIIVLAVDDEPDALNLVRRVLEGCGAQVLTAVSAREALEMVMAERPHIIISDIGMPDEDGYEFIRKVRALAAAQGGRTPAAALTAFARAEDRTRALRAGYQTHVAKPVEPAELTAVVASLAARP